MHCSLLPRLIMVLFGCAYSQSDPAKMHIPHHLLMMVIARWDNFAHDPVFYSRISQLAWVHDFSVYVSLSLGILEEHCTSRDTIMMH